MAGLEYIGNILLEDLCEKFNVPFKRIGALRVVDDDNGVVWVYGFGVTKRNCADKHSDNIILVRGKNNDK